MAFPFYPDHPASFPNDPVLYNLDGKSHCELRTASSCPEADVSVTFCSQPPSQHRKSTFFTFELTLGAPHARVREAAFDSFVDNGGPLENQNGVRYKIFFETSKVEPPQTFNRYLYIWLVDSVSYELIRYEGKNCSEMEKRVLLTHELCCARCLKGESCGNSNEMPSHPVLMDKETLRFHLKFNQNCLKSSGNPKGTRRFKLLITMSSTVFDKGTEKAWSDPIFVHNNSKKVKNKSSEVRPKITAVGPENGFPGCPLVVLGKHFDEDTSICVNGVAFPTRGYDEMLCTTLGDLGPSGPRTIGVRKGDKLYNCSLPFHYDNPSDHRCLSPEDCLFCRNLSILISSIPSSKRALYQNLLIKPDSPPKRKRDRPLSEYSPDVMLGNVTSTTQDAMPSADMTSLSCSSPVTGINKSPLSSYQPQANIPRYWNEPLPTNHFQPPDLGPFSDVPEGHMGGHQGSYLTSHGLQDAKNKWALQQLQPGVVDRSAPLDWFGVNLPRPPLVKRDVAAYPKCYLPSADVHGLHHKKCRFAPSRYLSPYDFKRSQQEGAASTEQSPELTHARSGAGNGQYSLRGVPDYSNASENHPLPCSPPITPEK